jgi:hypothetical protein
MFSGSYDRIHLKLFLLLIIAFLLPDKCLGASGCFFAGILITFILGSSVMNRWCSAQEADGLKILLGDES